MPRPTYPATLVAKHQLSSNTVQLDFKVEHPLIFEAGQFVQLHFNHEGQDYKRSYSVANSPESFQKTGILEIALSFVDGGIASQFFQTAEAGTELAIGGPFGILTAPESFTDRIILVGTGTGLAPYRSMIPQLNILQASGAEVVVVMGVRHRSDLIYEADFREFSEQAHNVEYRVCFSREADIDGTKGEYQGYVQNQFPALTLKPDTDLVYLCGNPLMIDDALKELKEAGLGPRQIKREKYVYSS